jgi:serine/threonine protein kinase
MDHPNIAKILDAGTTGGMEKAEGRMKKEEAAPLLTSAFNLLPSPVGRPYFVMELVRGIKITEYCDKNQLSTHDRLRLFILVCRAIQHAHQKGVIHRDIKPSNILVTLHDGVPVPKVIDFGIAKATQQELTDKTVFTQFQQFIGTPAYISPEQAEMSGLDIDTRSDIYSLGVLLYELLVGQTPFDAKEMIKGGIDALRRIIREKEPAKPSTRLKTLSAVELTSTAQRRQTDASRLTHLLHGDLDWIVMKCLEKDRARRYETANGLAADLLRYLANEPVVARPPTTAYRVRKMVRRNRTAFAAAAFVGLAVVLGLGSRVPGPTPFQPGLPPATLRVRDRPRRYRLAIRANRPDAHVAGPLPSPSPALGMDLPSPAGKSMGTHPAPVQHPSFPSRAFGGWPPGGGGHGRRDPNP